MKKSLSKIVFILVLSGIIGGCAHAPPFNNRVDYIELKQVKNLDSAIDSLNLVWTPSDFPKSIEVKGASGFRGAAAQIRIPTGISISSRLIEALDQSLTVDDKAIDKLEIKIINAESNFTFISGFLSVDLAIDWGEVIIDAEFYYNGKIWIESFYHEENDERIDGSSLTRPLEIAWDKVSVAMAQSIIEHINEFES